MTDDRWPAPLGSHDEWAALYPDAAKRLDEIYRDYPRLQDKGRPFREWKERYPEAAHQWGRLFERLPD
jgi:hypothetical protein